MMQSATGGRSSGMLVVLGLCTGLLGHTFAVAAGLAAVLAASETAFAVLKLAGAAYLVWLAWGAFRSKGDAHAGGQALRLGAGQLYRRGIVMNLTNPKVTLFFLAFLPQFTSSARGPIVPQILSLGALFILATLLVFGAIAWFAGMFGERMRQSARAQRLLNRAAGVVFLGLAVKLALSER